MPHQTSVVRNIENTCAAANKSSSRAVTNERARCNALIRTNATPPACNFWSRPRRRGNRQRTVHLVGSRFQRQSAVPPGASSRHRSVGGDAPSLAMDKLEIDVSRSLSRRRNQYWCCLAASVPPASAIIENRRLHFRSIIDSSASVPDLFVISAAPALSHPMPPSIVEVLAIWHWLYNRCRIHRHRLRSRQTSKQFPHLHRYRKTGTLTPAPPLRRKRTDRSFQRHCRRQLLQATRSSALGKSFNAFAR